MNSLSQMALHALFNAGEQPFYMTQAEGEELAQLGYITVNVNDSTVRQDGQTGYRVNITESGVNALSAVSQSQTPSVPSVPVVPSVPGVPTAVTPTAPAQKVKPTFEIETGIDIPSIVRGGGNLTPRETIYPFDQLEIGQSFHVAVTADNPEPWKRMASNVSGANLRFQQDYIDPVTGQPVMIEKETKTVVKDENGKKVKDANGKQVYTRTVVSLPKQVPTKKFVARRVGATDPKGPGVRVFRVALES